MKHTLRVLALFLSAALLVGSLTACHGTQAYAPFTLPEVFDTDKTYEITFWAKNENNKTQRAIYDQAIADFEALYPNIKVTIRHYSDYSRIYNDVITNIPTKTTPNICVTYPDHIATYLTGKNVVVPLDNLISNEKYGLSGSEVAFDTPTRDEIVPKFLSECEINGRLYGLPFMRSTEACYVNKDYVEALGYTLPDVLTWDFIFEVSRAAMAKNEDGTYTLNGQNVMIPFIYKSTDNMMIQALYQKNAGYSTDDGDILLFNGTTEEFLLDIAALTQDKAFSTFKLSGYPGNFLNAGQCIFAIDSTAGATWMGTDAPLIDIDEDELATFEIAVRMIPQFDVSAPKMISQGPSLCIFNKEDPGEVLASWLFVQYLLTSDVQIAYAKTEGYIPVTSKAQTDPRYTDYLSRAGEDNDTYYRVKIETAKLLLDNIENTFVTPVFNGSASLRNAAGELIEGVTKAIRSKKSVDAAYVHKLYSDVTALYRLDEKSRDSGEKLAFGRLSAESVALLCGIGGAWVVMLTYGGWKFWRKKRESDKILK